MLYADGIDATSTYVEPPKHKTQTNNRDEYMANSLRTCPAKTIVAVVGMGHMDGIERNLGYEILPCRLGGRK